MIKSAKEFIQLRVSDLPKDYQRADKEEAPDEVWLDLIQNHPNMQEWVASNKSVPPHILNILSKSNDRKVRYFVARNHNISIETLWMLSKDSDESVRQRVAVNPKTPIELLKVLENDPWENVVEVVKERLEKLQEKGDLAFS